MPALLLTLVLAHPQGFHKRLSFELWSTAITALVVMDIDSGERCELLRAGADANRDGVLNKAEIEALKTKVTTLATRALKLSISAYPLAIELTETKLSLRGDNRVAPSGVSIAVLLQLRHPYAVTPGMSLTIEDAAPDGSHIEVDVAQHPADAGGHPEPETHQTMAPGQRVTVRLGALASP